MILMSWRCLELTLKSVSCPLLEWQRVVEIILASLRFIIMVDSLATDLIKN